MNDLGKVKHLIEHWIEHEREHAAAYEEWAEKIRHVENGEETAAALRKAAQKLYESVECLVKITPHDVD
jgi:NDP-sugar pyrophosphorylase family protein